MLRRWVFRKIIGLEPLQHRYNAGQPPYLKGFSKSETPAKHNLIQGVFHQPKKLTLIKLPGKTIQLLPDNPNLLFSQNYHDLETLLAVHRFSWIPLSGSSLDPNWIATLWLTWIRGFEQKKMGWPWHPYTAAERAINIIDFSRKFRTPGNLDETVSILEKHAEFILSHLEYYGAHNTSNHLSNNGRGLLRIGTALGSAFYAETGSKIMIAEAKQIFGASGILREGSTHYHVLLTKNYIDAWLDAKIANMNEAKDLQKIATKAMSIIPAINLPAGFPLIGDISPDVPPSYLRKLTGVAGDGPIWPDNLTLQLQREVSNFCSAANKEGKTKATLDGWHKFGRGDWKGIAFVPPDGWTPIPGHGHNDLGAFELHHRKTPVIVDPGRGSYEDNQYETVHLHSTISIDNVGPTPTNRPYYSNQFRKIIIKKAPVTKYIANGFQLQHWGFSRLPGIGSVIRKWQFKKNSVKITDFVNGNGRHVIKQNFFVIEKPTISEKTVIFHIGTNTFRLRNEFFAQTASRIRWLEYGRGEPGWLLTFETKTTLPFKGHTFLERI